MNLLDLMAAFGCMSAPEPPPPPPRPSAPAALAEDIRPAFEETDRRKGKRGKARFKLNRPKSKTGLNV